MELRHLKLVLAVAEQGTLSSAAKILNLSQSALSHQLKELETELGVEVFHRMNKRLVISEAGRILLQTATDVSSAIAKAEQQIYRHVNDYTGEIKVSTECYTCYHWLPQVLCEFKESFRHVEISIHPELVEEPIRMLQEGHVDVVITSSDQEAKDIVYKELFVDEMFAVVACDHPWAHKEYVEAKDFEGQNLFIYGKPLDTVFVYRKVLEPHGIKPAKITEIKLTEAAIEMIKGNYGVKVMAGWAVAPYLKDPRLRAVRVTPLGLWRTWFLAFNSKQPWRDHHEALVRSLRTSMRLPGEVRAS